MKHFLTMLLLVASMCIQAQINIVESESQQSEQIKSGLLCKLVYKNQMYTLCCGDIGSASVIYVHLGPTKEIAKESLMQIYKWFKSAKNKQYMRINQEGEYITFYRVSSTSMLISTGDEEVCQKYANTLILGALVDGLFLLRGVGKNEIVSSCDISNFKRIIKSLK